MNNMDQEVKKVVSSLLQFKAEYGHYGIGYLLDALAEADHRLLVAIDEALTEMRAD